MSSMGIDAIVEQLAHRYSEEAVLDQLAWSYEKQIWRVSEDIHALLPGYRRRVDVATYAREKQFLMLDLAHGGGLSLRELEAVFMRLIEHRQVFAATARHDAHGEPPGPVRAPAAAGA